jgi:outer membrane protein assembly factor BamB
MNRLTVFPTRFVCDDPPCNDISAMARRFRQATKLLWFFVLAGMMTGLAVAGPAWQPVGRWKFDEDRGSAAHDSVGKNDGAVHGCKWSAGAASFQVSGDYIEIPDHPTLNINGEITIAVWIKAMNFNAPIVNKMPSGTASLWSPGNFEFCTEPGGYLGFLHQTDGRRGSSRYRSQGHIAAGQWHHVAVTLLQGKEVVFYIDGAPAGSARQSGKFGVVNTEPVRVGGRKDPYSWFHGQMSDLCIYNHALGAEDIRTIVSEHKPVVAEPKPAGKPEPEATLSPAVGEANSAAQWQWPQWRGPDRNGKSKETGLLASWPAEGPKLLWHTARLGNGYSTVSVADGLIYTTGTVEDQEWLFAMDLQGRLKWKVPYGSAWNGPYPEARTTPTVNDGHVYVISGMGRICCFDARGGQQRWDVDAMQRFGGKYHTWGIAESPLIDGDKVFCTPAGDQTTMVAMNKRTGHTVWASEGLDEMSAYCSPILIERGQTRLVVQMLGKSIVGIDSANGEILWREMFSAYQKAPHHVNPNSPIYHDGCIYTTSGYACGGALHQLSSDGRSIARKWVDRVLNTHHGNVVLVDGYIYGSTFISHVTDGRWACLKWESGQVMYDRGWITKGSITFADGMLYCYEERKGMVALVKPSPRGFEVVSSFQVALGNGMHWAHPVVCNGRLYIRHGDTLMAYDVKENQ